MDGCRRQGRGGRSAPWQGGMACQKWPGATGPCQSGGTLRLGLAPSDSLHVSAEDPGLLASPVLATGPIGSSAPLSQRPPCPPFRPGTERSVAPRVPRLPATLGGTMRGMEGDGHGERSEQEWDGQGAGGQGGPGLLEGYVGGRQRERVAAW